VALQPAGFARLTRRLRLRSSSPCSRRLPRAATLSLVRRGLASLARWALRGQPQARSIRRAQSAAARRALPVQSAQRVLSVLQVQSAQQALQVQSAQRVLSVLQVQSAQQALQVQSAQQVLQVQSAQRALSVLQAERWREEAKRAAPVGRMRLRNKLTQERAGKGRSEFVSSVQRSLRSGQTQANSILCSSSRTRCMTRMRSGKHLQLPAADRPAGTAS
jgi:hypothetical protein